MPPRTGPRRKKRQKPTPACHFTIIHTSTWLPDPVIAHRVELDDGHLVLRDESDAITRIIASGEWREIRPAMVDDLPLPPEPDEEDSREQATLVGEADLAIPPEEDRRFVPASPEEAQRILMELNRRQGTDHAAPPSPADPARPKE